MAVEEQINTEGVQLVGEFVSRTMREVIVDPDYQNAKKYGAVAVLEEVIAFAQARIDAAGEYDDVRALHELKLWTADKIRSVNSIATDGTQDA